MTQDFEFKFIAEKYIKIIIIVYLYSAQYLNILQDWRSYLTHLNAQVLEVTVILVTERQRFRMTILNVFEVV